jgi:hypothetical protein
MGGIPFHSRIKLCYENLGIVNKTMQFMVTVRLDIQSI